MIADNRSEYGGIRATEMRVVATLIVCSAASGDMAAIVDQCACLAKRRARISDRLFRVAGEDRP